MSSGVLQGVLQRILQGVLPRLSGDPLESSRDPPGWFSGDPPGGPPQALYESSRGRQGGEFSGGPLGVLWGILQVSSRAPLGFFWCTSRSLIAKDANGKFAILSSNGV